MADRSQYPDYEVQKLFEATKTEHPLPNTLLGTQIPPVSVAGYFAEKVLELARGLQVDPILGERVYAFLGAVFLTGEES